MSQNNLIFNSIIIKMKKKTTTNALRMSSKLLLITLIINFSSCNQTGVENPLEPNDFKSPQARAQDFGDIHNKSMNSILTDIKAQVGNKESLEKAHIQSSSGYFQLASFDQNPDFDLNDIILQSTFESIEREGIIIPTQMALDFAENAEFFISDEIHTVFNSGIEEIRKTFELFENKGIINNIDLSIIEDLVSLSFDVNEAFLTPNGTNVYSVESRFQSRLNDIITTYDSNEQFYSPITIALVSIVESSRDYWLQQNLNGEPGVIPISYDKDDFIIPVFLARIIVKDAIGAIVGILGAGFGKRILAGDWDFDTSKLTSDEALVAALIGAISSSGGFLGKWALRVLFPV